MFLQFSLLLQKLKSLLLQKVQSFFSLSRTSLFYSILLLFALALLGSGLWTFYHNGQAEVETDSVVRLYGSNQRESTSSSGDLQKVDKTDHDDNANNQFVDHGWTFSSADYHTTIFVDVAGAVKHPGVYELPLGARVVDLIRSAGGVSSKVDKVFVAQNINGASRMIDQQKIYIPFQIEMDQLQQESDALSNSSVGTSNANNSGNDQGSAVVNNSASVGRGVSINSATQAQLQELDGIGEKRAQAIIAGRPYSSIDELVKKSVIGQALFDSIKNHINL